MTTPLREVFETVIKERRWGPHETPCGAGSTLANTTDLRISLVHLALGLKLKSILDIGCGDGHWMKTILPLIPGVEYTGVDVVDFSSSWGGRRFLMEDYSLPTAKVPSADLIICKDVIMHLPLERGVNLLKHIQESGSKWLLSTHRPEGYNKEIKAGEYFPVNLMKAPFNLPEPDAFYEQSSVGLWRLR